MEAKFGMTLDSNSLNYLQHLYDNVYKEFSSCLRLKIFQRKIFYSGRLIKKKIFFFLISRYISLSKYSFSSFFFFNKKATKTVKQYSFYTKSHPLFTSLQQLWYKWDESQNKFIKIIPMNVSEMFSELSLAYWIMVVGFF